MPKRTDIKKILVVGAGPIVIGQACEFDYSGTQACKALKEEGYEVVLVNSNPATIMTDPSFADKTYIEPITPDFVRKIIAKEKPDALLPTMGGQTSLNIAVALANDGTLDEYNVELIGAKLPAIEVAEDRELFSKLMVELGLNTPRSSIARSLEDGHRIADEIGFPLILRPAFTLGGAGGGIAYNREELDNLLTKGLNASPSSQVLVEQSVIGWKEFEMEVMRDFNDNVVIICSIENLDPMGVHTGDSITVAPIQTLSDKEYQLLRDYSIKIIRGVGIETGGCNIQFALNPENGELIVIEMNPRVSRSSALASKATGFPIAKIAAKLAVGYTLDEIPNDITKTTMASFEPSIDYVVTKIPRFAFEKFKSSDDTLGTQMKSVGETMAVGRTFKESFQKALRGLETGAIGFYHPSIKDKKLDIQKLKNEVIRPSPKRIFNVFKALYNDISVEEIHNLSKIDYWFLAHLSEIVAKSKELTEAAFKNPLGAFKDLEKEQLQELKSQGFGDKQLAELLNCSEKEIRERRKELAISPVYKTIDTCAGEFESYTPYHYSSYDQEDEVKDSGKEKVFIIGGGPNRIGQGIEFDYCCVHAAHALNDAGYETIMVNNNPETVSTDYDTSGKLYFEPITAEDVLAIWNRECERSREAGNKEPLGAIVQLGGQTPLNISQELEANGVTILGTSPESIDLAEDRERFGQILDKLELKQTANGIAKTVEEAIKVANDIGYPVMVRPSYVLGGRGMGVVYDQHDLEVWLDNIKAELEGPQAVILIDKFLDKAKEIDVDTLSDGTDSVIAGIMEHIEYAGVHSGDSSCVLPSISLEKTIVSKIKHASKELAKALNVRGLMNIQFAVKDEELYILEVNPRASRTVPFVSKATGVQWAKLASLVMTGKTLKELGVDKEPDIDHIAVKKAVFSFNRFAGGDIDLGPEMKSTGEVMGISDKFSTAFAKSQIAASLNIPKSGKVFISVNDRDKAYIGPLALNLQNLGFKVVSTTETAKLLNSMGIETEPVKKLSEGRPNALDLIKNNEINLIINIPDNKQSLEDNKQIGHTALVYKVPTITTITGTEATIKGIQSLQNHSVEVEALQNHLKRVEQTNP